MSWEEEWVCQDCPGWQDKYETTCAQLEGWGNCENGESFMSSSQMQHDMADGGVIAADGCCACGRTFSSPCGIFTTSNVNLCCIWKPKYKDNIVIDHPFLKIGVFNLIIFEIFF